MPDDSEVVPIDTVSLFKMCYDLICLNSGCPKLFVLCQYLHSCFRKSSRLFCLFSCLLVVFKIGRLLSDVKIMEFSISFCIPLLFFPPHRKTLINAVFAAFLMSPMIML